MSVGALCFTSSGSNGGCWVVLVFPRLFVFFWKNGFFFPIRDLRQKKFTRLTPKKFSVEKKRDLRQKKDKKSDLRLFPQSSYAFLMGGGSLACTMKDRVVGLWL